MSTSLLHIVRRETRQSIVDACDTLGISLANNTIENLINERVSEAGAELATGEHIEVDWIHRVKAAKKKEDEGDKIFRRIAIRASKDGGSGFKRGNSE